MRDDIDRYEKTRSDWLLAHESKFLGLFGQLSDRRMANALKRKADEQERLVAGAAESPHHEGELQPIILRFINGAEDSKDMGVRFIVFVLYVVPLVVIGIGPALSLSYVAYYATAEACLRRDASIKQLRKMVPESVPKRDGILKLLGRAVPGPVPKRKSWLIASGVVAVIGVVAWLLNPNIAAVAMLRVYPEWVLTPHWFNVALVYGWLQLTLSIALTAWQIRRHGWPGVKPKGTAKVPRMPTLPSLLGRGGLEPKDDVSAEGSAEDSSESAVGPKVPNFPMVPSFPTPDSSDDEGDASSDDEDDLDFDQLIERKSDNADIQ